MKTANKEATAMKSWQKLGVAITHSNRHCEIPRKSVESWQNKQSAVSLENKQGEVSLVIHKTLCHTERSEVSQVELSRDISVSTKPQYDNVGGHNVSSLSLAEGARGWVNPTSASQAKSATAGKKNTHPQTPSAREGALREPNTVTLRDGAFKKPNTVTLARQYDTPHTSDKKPHTTPTSRKIALSLITASALGSASLELAIAGTCTQKYDGSQNYLDCTGDFAPQDLQTAINNKSMLINLGRGENNPLSVGAGTVTASISNNLVFRSVSAPNTDFAITGSSNAGLLLPYTLGNHTANASTIRSISVSGTINNQSWGSDAVYGAGVKIAFDVHAGTQIGRREADGTIIGGITINSGASITSAAMAIYGGYDGGTRSTFVSQITNNGSIQTLNLGYYKFSGDYASLLGNYFIGGASGTINTLNVYQSTLTLDSNGNEWSKHTINGNTGTGIKKNGNGRTDEHIAVEGTISILGTVGEGAIRINIGEGVTSSSEKYEYKNIILDKSGGKGQGKVTFESLRAGLGTKLHRAGNDGFTVSADVSTSYGSSMWRTLSLSYARRSIMLQNIMDSLLKKNFRSSSYDKTSAKARGEMFETNKFTGQVRYAPSMRKLGSTSRYRKRQTKVEEKFLPYDSKKTHIAFFVPYAVNSLADMGITNATEWAGGILMGVQKDLKQKGIVGVYAAYEYAHITTQMLGATSIAQTNAIQTGATYFKLIPIQTKKRQVREGYLKANLRGGVDIPMLKAQSPLPHIQFELESNSSGSTFPLMWSIGGELRGGWTFYQYKSGGYISPEFGISYDVLAPLAMKLAKAKYGLGGNEYYPEQYWHLPQLGASVKYYKVWGERFKTSFLGGLRYNILNTPTGSFRIGGLPGEGKIYLPALYGNLDMDFVWIVKRNHELSLGYNGIFFSNFNFVNGDDGRAANKFNGMSNALNIKYALFLGGEFEGVFCGGCRVY
ncbi:hypothetical protein, partial [Helicobacter sp. MIT 01-3238]|uniref:hypothetical protein n=1 Tax=Helicobacter sp. MIT 01-3238 TaxID=398627 RepID=UPI000E37A35E